jgi:hypothetical protein
MKRFNIYTGIIGSLLLLATASCDQENEGVKYTAENEGIAFLTAESEILAAPTETSVTYKIVRSNVNGRLELPIVADYDEAVFTLPSTVVFEDGAGTAGITIPLEKTELGVAYPITLSVDSVKSSPFGFFKTTVSVMRDYNWLSAGVAEFYSSWVGNEEGIDVKIEHAEGTNPSRYRLVSPYYVMEPDYCPKPGYHLVFELDENQNALHFFDGQKIGEADPDYGEIFFFSSEDDDTFTNDGNVFTILGWFYVGAGGYGQMPETFIWKEGYPGTPGD